MRGKSAGASIAEGRWTERESGVAVESSRYDRVLIEALGKMECETDGADFGVGGGIMETARRNYEGKRRG